MAAGVNKHLQYETKLKINWEEDEGEEEEEVSKRGRLLGT